MFVKYVKKFSYKIKIDWRFQSFAPISGEFRKRRWAQLEKIKIS